MRAICITWQFCCDVYVKLVRFICGIPSQFRLSPVSSGFRPRWHWVLLFQIRAFSGAHFSLMPNGLGWLHPGLENRNRNRTDEKQSTEPEILLACRDGERESKFILFFERQVLFRLPRLQLLCLCRYIENVLSKWLQFKVSLLYSPPRQMHITSGRMHDMMQTEAWPQDRNVH